MRSFLAALVGVTIIASQGFAQQKSSDKTGPGFDSKPQYQDDTFKNNKKKIATLWHSIPFFPGGDLGQYEKTMSQDRDSVRNEFWNTLMSSLEKMADKGAVVEVMLEPMANILMMFDQVHDIHKAKDIVGIDFSLEQQFKSALDDLFIRYDVRDDKRKIQISEGTKPDLLQAYIRGISTKRPLGKPITADELNVTYAIEMLNQIDYVAYGTFSSLGKGKFQLTFHVQGNKNGVTRNFISRGKLTEALDDLAKQVFDFFQKNVYEDWDTPHKGLKWLPMPINEERKKRMEDTGVYDAYTFAEAKTYCQARGYRLPYSRELLMAESGTEYKDGGIKNLNQYAMYAVADRRSTLDNLWVRPINGDSTGGPFMGDGSLPMKGLFWCVKGTPAPEIQLYEKVWTLLRKYRNVDLKVYTALETIRAEIGDFDVSFGSLFWKGSFVTIQPMNSMEEALSVLRKKGIQLEVPGYLNP